MFKGFIYKYKYIGITVILLLIFVWAVRYYSEEVTYLNGDKYRIAIKSDDEIVLKSSRDNVVVLLDHLNRTVKIKNQDYSIRWVGVSEQYVVTYPSGQQLKVDNEATHAFTMGGELYFVPAVLVSEGGRVVSSKSNSEPESHYEKYHPTSVVKVAYEHYYEKQGIWKGFLFALISASIGIALFLSEPLQRFLFSLRYRLEVVDPEPTDFYYITTKITGLIIVGWGIAFFIMSL